jgi:intracellular multiplication protein IcmT
MQNFSGNAHWRDTARDPKLWVFDYYAVFPIVIMLFHITWITFYIAISVMLFLSIIKRYGFSVPVFLRVIRSTLAGKRKLSMPWWM